MSPSRVSATRRAPPPQIHQDNHASASVHTEQGFEATLLNALQPLSSASQYQNIQLTPTIVTGPASSPVKMDSSPPRPVTAHEMTDVKLPPPSDPSRCMQSPRKNGQFYSSTPTVAPLPQGVALFGAFPSSQRIDQENGYEVAPFGHATSLDTGYGYKAPLKRALLEAAPMKDRSAKKQRIENEEPFELPHPSEMPVVVDDGGKPAHSYAELIGMAILRAPNRRLTLAQIYKWISDSFTFYKTSETGWQNSIRHNLSLNKNFIKQERPKDDPGKGNYWAIKPGEERPYLLGKKHTVRRITNPDGSTYMANLSSDIGHFPSSSATPAISHFTLAPNPVRRPESRTTDSVKLPDLTELSSDGTIPASDPALQEDDRDDNGLAMPPPQGNFRSSPPPADIRSSPPPVATQSHRDTPPSMARYPSAGRSEERRHKFGGLNDSGYWSSIESSAARGAAHQLTLELDPGRHRIKKGRAEAEIARIRSSSFDSPTKDHSHLKAPTPPLRSSSPPKEDNPLTPAVVFKRPPRPPPSISPNTNLRNHRNRMRALLGSPAKPYSPLRETQSWSPAFHLGDEGHVDLTPYFSPYKQSKSPWKGFMDAATGSGSAFNNAFDIFIDAPEEDLTTRGSPEKRHTRRPSLVRAATSSGILADVTGSGRGNMSTSTSGKDNTFSLSPFLSKSPKLFSPTKLGSPLKQIQVAPPQLLQKQRKTQWNQDGSGNENSVPDGVASPKQDGSDGQNAELLSDGSEEGIDIFQDFGKIGQAPQFSAGADRSNGSPVKKSVMGPPARPVVPGLPRHRLSRW